MHTATVTETLFPRVTRLPRLRRDLDKVGMTIPRLAAATRVPCTRLQWIVDHPMDEVPQELADLIFLALRLERERARPKR
ncbi:MAG: hypothetical protein KIS92_01070 [Planctomycetota bacterium]|nr:hypothetical protein [Planctomycetota bacterium]